MSEAKGNIQTYLDKKISNLNVNQQKMYELSKCNTKIVMNTLGCGIIVLGVAHLALTFMSPLLIIPGAFVISNTIKNAKMKHKDLVANKKVLKK